MRMAGDKTDAVQQANRAECVYAFRAARRENFLALCFLSVFALDRFSGGAAISLFRTSSNFFFSTFTL